MYNPLTFFSTTKQPIPKRYDGTRFAATTNLHELYKCMLALDEKIQALQQEMNDASSLAFAKGNILKELQNNIDSHINEFNCLQLADDDVLNVLAEYKLAKAIHHAANQLTDQQQHTLQIKRKFDNLTINKQVEMNSMAAYVVMTGISLTSLVNLYIGHKVIHSIADYQQQQPAYSATLVKELSEKAHLVKKNLSDYLVKVKLPNTIKNVHAPDQINAFATMQISSIFQRVPNAENLDEDALQDYILAEYEVVREKKMR